METKRVYDGINYVNVEIIYLSDLVSGGFVYNDDGVYRITEYCGTLENLESEIEVMETELEKTFKRLKS